MLLPKQGSSSAECEDAQAVMPPTDPQAIVSGIPLVAAVSDGASESMLAKDWSRMLADRVAQEAFADRDLLGGPTGSYSRFVTELVDSWEPWLAEYTKQRAEAGRPLRWYEQAKLESGAFATLLAFRIDLPPQGDHASADEMPDTYGPPRAPWGWRAAALGDSCLFQVRDHEVVTRFPVESAQAFGTTPDLLGSRNRDTALVAERTRFTSGDFRRDDDFFLMTDALAAWFLALADGPKHELQSALWTLIELSRTNNQDGFRDWVSRMRADGTLHNDDVTFVHIDILE
ncbi:hypothetical protein ABUW04_28040 [Streptacidiphilus sp. N1-10]|uniref:Protein phosphatase 2C-like protein n=1 Tax=Streptacidiphilus jeojiensis TaxID=3229225 RepID=A0ABV6XVZ1_9ACTN